MIGPDDPRLTAHLVDEVDAETAAAVDEALRESAAVQGAARDIRETARLVADALRGESGPALHPAQRVAIAEAARSPRPRVPQAALWAGLAAALAAAAGVLVGRSTAPRTPETVDVSPRSAEPPVVARSEGPPPAAPAPPRATVTGPPAESAPVAPEVAPPLPEAPLRRAPAAPAAVATVHGVVKDPTGAPLPGVTIVVRSRGNGTTATVVSDPRGAFRVNGRFDGAVELEAQLDGFKTARQEMAAAAGADVPWQPTLQVGAVAETVTVVGVAPTPEVSASAGIVQAFDLSGVTQTLPFGQEREFNTESYAHRADGEFVQVARRPLSTFSVDVDTASYSNVRRFLNEGHLPPADAVRIEEMVNYFPYDYRAPGREPFAADIEMGPAPWAPNRRLLRIGLKTPEIAQEDRPASNLVFLVDVSGSMQPANKLPLVKRSLEMLVERLDGRDRVAVVVYAGAAGLVLPPTSGDDKTGILLALQRLEAGGSTNGAQGIQLAYDIAAEGFVQGGNNRVILATDGDFNVGTTDEGSLTRLIQERAKEGVFLTVLGFGMGNYKDSTLELLADKGNGNYAYIDNASEARKALVEELTSTLVAVAKDVKVQVEFNPTRVHAYRLLGYENRLLRPPDFQDDRKDAGEVGAGHAVTVLYEILPARPGAVIQSPEPPLRYVEPGRPTAAARSDELMRLRIRYKEPDGEASRLLEWSARGRATSLRRTSEDYRFAAAVAAFGMILRDTPEVQAMSLDDVLALAREARGRDRGGYRAEFVELVEKARVLRQRGEAPARRD
jgi:Ca-activated chloride channel family protein